MNVLVITEDFRKDQYILKPIVEALMAQVGRPNAKVRVCQDPLLGGVGQALKWERVQEILARYSGMVDLFLLIVNRDCEEGRRDALTRLEGLSAAYLGTSAAFLAEQAWQEVEVWVLAAHDAEKAFPWADVRAERDPKERYFAPLAEYRKLLDEPGQGRKTLAKEAAGRFSRIRQLCPEVADLEQRIRATLSKGESPGPAYRPRGLF